MKYKIFFAFSFILIPLFSFSSVSAATFERNLKQGSQGSDVLALQKILNTNAQTQIGDVGPGSPGNETTYFGQKTALSVIKFQKNYAISPAVGFVGPLTRQKLNEFSQIDVKVINDNIFTPTSSPDSVMMASEIVPFYTLYSDKTDKSPSIFQVSANQVAPGGTLMLQGVNFNQGPYDVLIGSSNVIHNPQGLSSTTAIVTVPTGISSGKYELWATNSFGASNGSSSTTPKRKQYIEITSNPLPKPVIISSQPRLSLISGTLKINGQNFTSTGNIVASGFGVIQNVQSSDGTTLEIRIQDFPGISKADPTGKLKGSEVPMTFTVINKGGISNQSGVFYVQF